MADNQITSYSFHKNAIRTITEENGEIIFCLPDVSRVLMLTNASKVAAQIKDEFSTPNLKLGMVSRPDGSSVQATFITEPQLYFVMMRSRAKVAREFRQWIVNEVLPSIRKTGAYSTRQLGEKDGVTKEDLEQLAKTSWYANKLFEVLKGKTDTVTTLECVQVASKVWRQGYAVACDRHEKEIKLAHQDTKFYYDRTEECKVKIKELEATVKKQEEELKKERSSKSTNKTQEAPNLVNSAVSNQEIVEIAQKYAQLGVRALEMLSQRQ